MSQCESQPPQSEETGEHRKPSQEAPDARAEKECINTNCDGWLEAECDSLEAETLLDCGRGGLLYGYTGNYQLSMRDNSKFQEGGKPF